MRFAQLALIILEALLKINQKQASVVKHTDSTDIPVCLNKNLEGIFIAGWQFHLYDTRMLIELNFRNLKMFHNLITSLPRSMNGYLAHYTYSLLSYLIS